MYARTDSNDNHGMMSAFAALLIVLPLFITGCQLSSPKDDCVNHDTYVADSQARHIVTIDLPFSPGPVAVVASGPEGFESSRSNRLWVGDGGTRLYALDGSRVWAIDLSSLERHSVGRVGAEAAQLAGSDDEGVLLVTERDRGTLIIMDSEAADAIEVPVGAGPGALALGPGHRIAYVANQWEDSLSLVETGLGTYLAEERSVVVAAADGGAALLLDGDGRVRQSYEGLPGNIRDLAVLPGGRQVLASYSSIEVGGDPDTLGDGELVLSEGLVLLDLDSGAVTTWALDRDARPEGMITDRMAQPTGVAILDGGQRAVVALPGWQGLGIIDLGPTSPTRGQLVDFIATQAAPRHVMPAADDKVSDWIYALDSETGTLFAIDREGRQVWSEQLR